MINYLTRRLNPTPYTSFIPTPVIIYGEQTILQSLQKHTPDFVLLVHKNTGSFGYRFARLSLACATG